MGIPVSCEVDIYGALSEYIGVCVSGAPTTLLDINNTVPASIYDKAIRADTMCACPRPSWDSIAATPAVRC